MLESKIKTEQINKILSMPFSYLAEGTRTYAYVSADDKIVIKLFKSPTEIKTAFFSLGIDLGKVSWSPKPNDSLGSAEIMHRNTLKSYQLAFDKLQEDTALIYIHSSETENLINNIRINGSNFNPNTTQFLLQHKAFLFGEKLVQLMSAGKTQEAKIEIDKLLDFIISLWKRGITEDTFNFYDNYGFFGNKIIQIDAGEFHQGFDCVKKEIFQKKIIKKESYQWLNLKYPDLASYLKDKVYEKFQENKIFNG